MKLRPKPTKKQIIKYDPLLYGRDMESNIVAVEPISGEPMVEIFKRENGRLTRRYEKAKAYFYTNIDEPVLNDLWDDDTQMYELEGNLHYNVLVETNNIRTAWWFRKNATKGNTYIVRERGQYLLASGKTLFKGMAFDDIVRMYPDLETYTTPGYKFSNPERAGDKILLIPIKTNQKTNNKYILVLDEDDWGDDYGAILKAHHPDTEFLFCKSEEDLLQTLFVLTNDIIDPDAIINHNIFNFDLRFIYERCRMHGIPMELGRDYTTPNLYDSDVYYGDKSMSIMCFEFYGRHVLDTEILARQVDNVKRKFENYQLKYLIRELGKQREGRVIVPGPRIAAAWDNTDKEFTRMDLISYALDDAEDAQTIDQTFGRAAFDSTKFTPYPYQDVFRLATGGKSETLFVRHYYDKAHSLPKPDKYRHIRGGLSISRMKELGIRVRYGLVLLPNILIDVKSLYPTIGLEHNIQPKDDVLGFYRKIIQRFRDFRYTIKDAIADATAEIREQLESADTSIKPYLNTIAYGYLASKFSLFNDFDEAQRITDEGQKVLANMVRVVEKHGGTFIRGDTDGAIILPPDRYSKNEETETEFVAKVDAEIDGFDIGLDGRYQSALIIDGKSYALLDYHDKVIIKGDTLKSRSKENFILKHLSTVVKGLLKGNFDILEESFFYWEQRIKNKELTKDDVFQYQEIKEPLETYRTKVELGSGNGGRNPSAAYEIACQLEDDGTEIKVGDRVEYYVASSPVTLVLDGRTGKPRVKEKYSRVCDLAKNIDDFDASRINTDHYLQRLRDSSEPIYMLFYNLTTLKETFGFKMYKKQRDNLEEKSSHIFNDIIN